MMTVVAGFRCNDVVVEGGCFFQLLTSFKQITTISSSVENKIRSLFCCLVRDSSIAKS